MIRSQILFSGAFVCLSFFLVMLSALRLTQPELFAQRLSRPVLAQKQEANALFFEASDSATIAQNKVIDYPLPYPGILPDHPLYWLKMLRDRVNLSLTRNNLSRFDLQLLYADKRLASGLALITKGQDQLGVTTITKGEKYLVEAWEELESQDEKVPEVFRRREILSQAVAKHQQKVIQAIQVVEGREKEVLAATALANKQFFEPKEILVPLEIILESTPATVSAGEEELR
jgi:hypothetical protein